MMVNIVSRSRSMTAPLVWHFKLINISGKILLMFALVAVLAVRVILKPNRSDAIVLFPISTSTYGVVVNTGTKSIAAKKLTVFNFEILPYPLRSQLDRNECSRRACPLLPGVLASLYVESMPPRSGFLATSSILVR